MAIYVEARDIAGAGGLAGGHLYLVYVPDGQESNDSAWKTISAFPETESGVGPWGLLEGRNIDEFLSQSEDQYLTGETPEDRGRVLLYDGADEATVWQNLTSLASNISNQFTYKAFGAATTVWGPGINSNSFIGSILHHAGYEIANHEPDPPNWVFDFNVAAFHLLGTTGDDVLTTDYNTTVLYGGLGADTLTSTSTVLGTLSAP